MKKKTMRLISLSLALTLLFVLSSCAASPSASNVPSVSPSTSPSGNASASPEASPTDKIMLSGYEFNTAPVTLTAVIDWPQSFDNWGDDLVSKWITDTVGVTIDIKWATTSTSEEMSLLLAGGQKLPDLMVCGGGGVIANTLVQQKYAAPLDELAKEYFPGFLELLPDKMYEIYQEDDGHLYRTADWFADTDRLLKFRDEGGYVTDGSNQSMNLNRSYWEKLGSPEINTLTDLRTYLNDAKKAYPDVSVPFMMATTLWNDSQDTVNFIYRLYGGQDWLYDDGTSNIKLCLGDERYKQALQYLNNLYRDGVLSDESFAMATETFESTLAKSDVFAFSGQDFNWFGKVAGGDQLTGPVMPIAPPAAEGVSRDSVKLKSLLTSVGGYTAVFISEGSENAARAIEYLAFRYTDEAQTAERFGIENVTWKHDTDGSIIWTDEYNNYIAEKDWFQMSKKYGPNNGTHSWFCTNYICKLESGKSDYPVRAYSSQLNTPYMKNERIYDLVKVIKDDSVKMKYDQLMILVSESIVKCISAKSDADFDSQYNAYVAGAEGLGMADIEAYFTTNYKKWLERGLEG